MSRSVQPAGRCPYKRKENRIPGAFDPKVDVRDVEGKKVALNQQHMLIIYNKSFRINVPEILPRGLSCFNEMKTLHSMLARKLSRNHSQMHRVMTIPCD